MEERRLLSLSNGLDDDPAEAICQPVVTAPYASPVVYEPIDSSQGSLLEGQPPSYSLPALGLVTPVKDQGNCGACWAFATFGSLESNILVNGGPSEDLAELPLIFHDFDWGPCEGGNFQMSDAELTAARDPFYETEYTYSVPPVDPGVEGTLDTIHYYVREAPVYDTMNEIKNAIMSRGGLYTSFYVDGAYFDSTEEYYYYNGTADTNHAVTIVGWDDSISRTNFTGAAGVYPPGDGAWLIKNSWGVGHHTDGYFWLSYHDTHMLSGELYGVSFSDAVDQPETYETVYEWDDFGYVYKWQMSTVVNAFTATADEYLASVNFWTRQDGASYDVRVYDDFTVAGGPSNQLARVTGTITNWGNHTINLTAPVFLTIGNDFYVYLSITNGGQEPMASDGAWDNPPWGYSMNCEANVGESFYEWGGSWNDLNVVYPDYEANWCVKALTIEEGYIDSYDFGDAPDDAAAPLYPTLAVNNGACHALHSPWLGDVTDKPDMDPDGQPDWAAMGDDWDTIYGGWNDDEDGVLFTSALVPGNMATVTVTTTGSGLLNAWVDFGGDGSWAQAGDQIFVDLPLGTGVNVLNYAVPASAVPGMQTYARFRYSTQAGLSYDGMAQDGEVEDYEVFIEAWQYKWNQPPEPAYPDNVYLGWNEYSVQYGYQIGADDWVCTSDEPVTDVVWWGSFLYWDYPYGPPQMPDYFHITFWTDVPVGVDDWFSHPGYVLYEADVPYTCEWVGWDYDPRGYLPEKQGAGNYESCFRFEAELPDGFNQYEPLTVFWASIAAGYYSTNVDFPFGWKTRPRDPDSLAPDDGVVVYSPTSAWSGETYQSGYPLYWPTEEQSWDYAFELLSDYGEPVVKWEQYPDLSDMGMDVLAGPGIDRTVVPPSGVYEKFLADDFLCTQTGPITEIGICGSYLGDRDIGEAPLFNLAIYADIPASQSPTGYSMPGELLWSAYLYADKWWYTDAQEEFFDPNVNQIIGNDSQVWKYQFFIDPAEAFVQQEGQIYWLGVNHSFDLNGSGMVDLQDVNLLAAYEWSFGWKTSDYQWNDDAVFVDVDTYGTSGQVAPVTTRWQELIDPRTGESLDLSFYLVTQGGMKWFQPPEPYVPPDAYYGWDEYSVYWDYSQIVADDWYCDTVAPVTDIHWWGSFLNWYEPEAPYWEMPDAFHIGIWTDVPAGVDQRYSHPGEMIWESYAYDYGYEFVGWDFDPRWPEEPMPPEATFYFDYYLPPEEWFSQDVGNNIYWVSISAIYPNMGDIYHPFGWKTRPRDPESPAPDDAVMIWDPSKPVVGSVYTNGVPIEYPEGVSWDMAFILTTEGMQELDWGDAPDFATAPGYPTLSINNGANHIIGGPWLGDATDFPDSEPDGQPDPNALGDDLDTIYPPPNDDEDGVVIPPLMPGIAVPITVEVNSGGVGGAFVDGWIDFNGNMVWEAGEQIIGGWLPDGINAIPVTAPIGSIAGQTFGRFRISSYGGLSPVGQATDGEVEDHAVWIEETPIDWGDAPDAVGALGYPTLAVHNGASHIIGGPWLGDATDSPDADPDGQPDPNALGDDNDGNDDEDGVVIPPLVPGVAVPITVEVNSGGVGGAFVDAWIDFNGNMVWEAGEQIIGGWLPDGINAIPVTAPIGSIVGQTFGRFRISSYGGLSPVGQATDGEVEDHAVWIEETPIDWGDAPDAVGALGYPTLAVHNGANHIIGGPWLGDATDSPDADPDGQPDPNALGDDNDGNDDEDGVVIPSLVPGVAVAISIEVNSGGAGGAFVDGWIDFNGNQVWEAAEQVVGGWLPDGVNTVWVTAPFGSIAGQTFGRFRVSSYGGLSPVGQARDGEVEDHEVQILGLDFGDAPEGPYPTTLANNGAYHVIRGGPWLGNIADRPDSEPDGQPDSNAMGDDLDILYPPVNDDEDGVVFVTGLIPCNMATVQVTTMGGPALLSAWIDFGGDGSWAEPGDQIFADLPVANGVHALNFVVPGTASPETTTYARFRISTVAGLSYTGPADNGEVEDYEVYIERDWEYKWQQPPDPAQPDNVYLGWNEYSVQYGYQVGADDWVCTSYDPVTDVTWWGSFLGWDYAYEPTIMPDYFHVTFWTDVPAGMDQPYSHPGYVIHETDVYAYTCEWVGWDYDPRGYGPMKQPSGDYESCFRFDAALPSWFYQEQPEGIYWVSIAAGYRTQPYDYPFGWKTRPRDANSPAPDDAVVIRDPTSALSGERYISGYPLYWPTPDESWDFAFELHSQQSEPVIKWEQWPDVEFTGIDVNASVSQYFPPYVLADDFQCTTAGPLTNMVIFGSWLYDYYGPDPSAVEFLLSIHADIPADQSPTGYSMPGDVLWMEYFGPGDFGCGVYMGDLYEGWLNPPDMYEPYGDSACWQYQFIPHSPFIQQGTPDEPVVYWLDVQAHPLDPQAVFGWKTSMQHWNDDAVWAYGSDPPAEWNELRYPWGHELFPMSIDLAFRLEGEDTVQVTKWSQPPEPYVPEDAYRGWDEYSVYGRDQIVADDWVCTTLDPVTDVHWWGSFRGWYESEPPFGEMPTAFHIGIWTDDPAGLPDPFSHPEQMVWEGYATDYQFKFAGWDFDPRDPQAPPEATYLFDWDIPENQWFWQDGVGETVYWISISAVYDQPGDVANPFGWKTRERDPASPAPDDAVLIWDPTSPRLGSMYGFGAPIEFPDGVSWDMAFMLTTKNVTTLFWDELGNAEWSDLYPAPPIPQNSHWVDSGGNPVTWYPDDTVTNAVVRTDQVSVTSDRTAHDLRIASGVLAPSGTTTVSATGMFQVANAGEYLVELNGASNSLIAAAGSAYLDGTLDLKAVARSVGIDNWADETRTIITSAGGVNGTFATVPSVAPATHLGNGVFFKGVTYGANTVTVDVLQALSGDCNGDHAVEFADFVRLFNNWTGTGGTGKDWTQGDFNGDGAVEFSDFVKMFNHWTGAGGYHKSGGSGGAAFPPDLYRMVSALAQSTGSSAYVRTPTVAAHDAVFAAEAAGQTSAPSKMQWLSEVDPRSMRQQLPTKKQDPVKAAFDRVLMTA